MLMILSSVLMASGLVALVDDCIKRRWHQKGRAQMTVHTLMKSPLRLNINRRDRPQRPTLLREMTC